jgi:hypothetical protein
LNLRPHVPNEEGYHSTLETHLDCPRRFILFTLLRTLVVATRAELGGAGNPRRLIRIDRARVRASRNRADGLKIDRIPLTRHAAWSAKFEK